jgi:hypothetical protein
MHSYPCIFTLDMSVGDIPILVYLLWLCLLEMSLFLYIYFGYVCWRHPYSCIFTLVVSVRDVPILVYLLWLCLLEMSLFLYIYSGCVC